MRPLFGPLLRTEKGKPRYVDDGKTFTRDRISKDGRTQFWRCDYRTTCKARLHVRDGKIVKRVHEHTHLGDPAKVQVLSALTEMGRLASNTDDQTSIVVDKAISHLSPACRRALPTVTNLKRIVQRKRIAVATAHPEPVSLTAMEIPTEFTRYEKNPRGEFEDFLLHDGGAVAGDDRILIFSTEQNLNLLCRSDAWYMDGSVDTAPPLFSQVLSIHGLFRGQTYPLVFGLLPNRNQATYENFLTQLNDLTYGNLVPVSIVTDYETASICGSQVVFPEAEISGSFFHLVRDIQRKIQQEKLHRHELDSKFDVQCLMIACLAFVPPEDVIYVFNELADLLPPSLRPILNYFQDTYIGEEGQRDPIFPIDFWNMYHRALDGEECITLSVEAWHKAVEWMLGKIRPSLWKFLRGLVRRQKMRDTEIEHLINRKGAPIKRKRAMNLNKRIFEIVNDYANRDKMEYLKLLAHNIAT